MIVGHPWVASAVLGPAAVMEILLSSDESGTQLLLSVLLAVAATMPVGWLFAHWTAAATVVSAAFVSLIVEPRVTIAGLVVLAVTFYYTARHRHAVLVLSLLAPLAVVTVGELISVSGPAGGDVEVRHEVPAFDEPEDDRSQPSDSAGPHLYPLLVTSICVAAAAFGRLQRSRRTEAELQEQVSSFSGEIAEHTARGERARIARELHDVVAHRISSIAVQAETARLTTPGLPPEGSRQLEAIGDSARDALSEMRRLLGVLRKDADETTGRQPQPGIAQLPDLVDEARQLAGASVRLTVTGHMEPLDPGVELTAYRVVQESLTNARRHAPGSPVDIELGYRADTLVLHIRDTGPGPRGTDSDGHGLLGMRERVAAVGGTFAVGSGAAGGFVVTASLPRVVVDPLATPEVSHE